MPHYIQYTEQGIFLDYIEPEELHSTLMRRGRMGVFLRDNGSLQEIADYLGIYLGIHNENTLYPILESRINSIANRIHKLEEKQNGNIVT